MHLSTDLLTISDPFDHLSATFDRGRGGRGAAIACGVGIWKKFIHLYCNGGYIHSGARSRLPQPAVPAGRRPDQRRLNGGGRQRGAQWPVALHDYTAGVTWPGPELGPGMACVGLQGWCSRSSFDIL
jgi:hypothetical protein